LEGNICLLVTSVEQQEIGRSISALYPSATNYVEAPGLATFDSTRMNQQNVSVRKIRRRISREVRFCRVVVVEENSADTVRPFRVFVVAAIELIETKNQGMNIGCLLQRNRGSWLQVGRPWTKWIDGCTSSGVAMHGGRNRTSLVGSGWITDSSLAVSWPW
jgi:hypothetical protein